MTIEDIQTLVSRQLGRSGIPPDAHFIEDLDAESMDLVGIVAAVEDRFHIVIDEEEVPALLTARTLFDLARERAAKAGAR